MAADLVLLAEQEGIATVTVNRPEKLNALNEEVIARLTKVFEECRDQGSTRAVILTGAGDRAFVAGARQDHRPDRRRGPDPLEDGRQPRDHLFVERV